MYFGSDEIDILGPAPMSRTDRNFSSWLVVGEDGPCAASIHALSKALSSYPFEISQLKPYYNS
jgi:hypothetical protein